MVRGSEVEVEWQEGVSRRTTRLVVMWRFAVKKGGSTGNRRPPKTKFFPLVMLPNGVSKLECKGECPETEMNVESRKGDENQD